MDVNFSRVEQPLTAGRAPERVGFADKETNEVVTQNENNKEKPQNADKPQERNITEAVAEINDFVVSQGRQLNFSIDESSNRAVVKVTDTETGELIRQVPSDEVLKMARRIHDMQSDIGASVGVLFSKEV